jgi:hypothetical protein
LCLSEYKLQASSCTLQAKYKATSRKLKAESEYKYQTGF